MPLADTTELIDSLKSQHRQERRKLVRLNVQELIPAFAMFVLLTGIGLTADNGAAAYLTAAVLCLAVGLFLLGSTLRQRRAEGEFDDSVRGELQRTLSQLRHRSWLHRNVMWWYAIPLFIAVALTYVTSRLNAGTGLSGFDLVYGCGALGLGLFVYRANRKLAFERYEPEVARHQRLLDELD